MFPIQSTSPQPDATEWRYDQLISNLFPWLTQNAEVDQLLNLVSPHSV